MEGTLTPELRSYGANIARRFPEVLLTLGAPELEARSYLAEPRIYDGPLWRTVEINLQGRLPEQPRCYRQPEDGIAQAAADIEALVSSFQPAAGIRPAAPAPPCAPSDLVLSSLEAHACDFSRLASQLEALLQTASALGANGGYYPPPCQAQAPAWTAFSSGAWGQAAQAPAPAVGTTTAPAASTAAAPTQHPLASVRTTLPQQLPPQPAAAPSSGSQGVAASSQGAQSKPTGGARRQTESPESRRPSGQVVTFHDPSLSSAASSESEASKESVESPRRRPSNQRPRSPTLRMFELDVPKALNELMASEGPGSGNEASGPGSGVHAVGKEAEPDVALADAGGRAEAEGKPQRHRHEQHGKVTHERYKTAPGNITAAGAPKIAISKVAWLHEDPASPRGAQNVHVWGKTPPQSRRGSKEQSSSDGKSDNDKEVHLPVSRRSSKSDADTADQQDMKERIAAKLKQLFSESQSNANSDSPPQPQQQAQDKENEKDKDDAINEVAIRRPSRRCATVGLRVD
eukprot:TRINITY_DN33742_c0_g1_i1.p1 TRINITY_DN33742_c0_g1~~TRINITY_DN33742_c0_g1_i1.p1  ORF type:complete len:517 (+),score=93.19 TRINITY_DN33742_c0_g1_i1:56-1606(+)